MTTSFALYDPNADFSRGPFATFLARRSLLRSGR
jgi:hypothetical protein